MDGFVGQVLGFFNDWGSFSIGLLMRDALVIPT